MHAKFWRFFFFWQQSHHLNSQEYNLEFPLLLLTSPAADLSAVLNICYYFSIDLIAFHLILLCLNCHPLFPPPLCKIIQLPLELVHLKLWWYIPFCIDGLLLLLLSSSLLKIVYSINTLSTVKSWRVCTEEVKLAIFANLVEKKWFNEHMLHFCC